MALGHTTKDISNLRYAANHYCVWLAAVIPKYWNKINISEFNQSGCWLSLPASTLTQSGGKQQAACLHFELIYVRNKIKIIPLIIPNINQKIITYFKVDAGIHFDSKWRQDTCLHFDPSWISQ